MIKQLHPKNSTSKPTRNNKQYLEMPMQQMLREFSKELLQPREQAVKALLAKAAEMKLV